MSRSRRIHQHYAPRIVPGKPHHEILDWGDGPSQVRRFEILAEHVALAGKSLLDVGCGLGDLWGFLRARGLAVRYTGVDIVEPMVAQARREHPDATFLCADVFAANPFSERFDAVFCSGVFNLDLGNNLEFLGWGTARLMDLAAETLVFNLLHAAAPRRYDHCVYYEPAAVVEMLRGRGWGLEVVEGYLANDFTVVCRRHFGPSAIRRAGL